jgi:hypothetical protein
MRFLSDSEADSAIGFIDRTGTPNPRRSQFADPAAYGLVRFANCMRAFVDMYEDLGIPPRIDLAMIATPTERAHRFEVTT